MHEHIDARFGHVYRYHSRSDAHSVALCRCIMKDLIVRTPVLSRRIDSGEIVWETNTKFLFPLSRKAKTLDLAIGTLDAQVRSPRGATRRTLKDIVVACEAKSVMTEHGKSQPRVFDELNSAHGIVHAGRADAIAAGVTVVNIAGRFASPLRQTAGQRDLVFSRHSQPEDARRMVEHLRGLPIRDDIRGVGFDAYATIVIDCDNQGPAAVWTATPAPQPGDLDHYETFVERIGRFYTERFG